MLPVKNLTFTYTSSTQFIWSQEKTSSTYITFWSSASSLFARCHNFSNITRITHFHGDILPSFTDLLHRLNPASPLSPSLGESSMFQNWWSSWSLVISMYSVVLPSPQLQNFGETQQIRDLVITAIVFKCPMTGCDESSPWDTCIKHQITGQSELILP